MHTAGFRGIAHNIDQSKKRVKHFSTILLPVTPSLAPSPAIGLLRKAAPDGLAGASSRGHQGVAMLASDQSKPFRVLSDEEIAAVMEEGSRYAKGWKTAPPSDRTMWPAMFGLLCEFGPRVSELFWLKRSDVDLERRTVALTTLKRWRTIHDRDAGTFRVRIHRKRLVPLRSWLADTLRAHLDAQPLSYMVFPASCCQTWRCRVWRAWKTVCQRAGVGNFRVHDARHTVATRLAERDPLLAMEVLDHASLTTTTRYLHCRNLAQKFLSAPGARMERP